MTPFTGPSPGLYGCGWCQTQMHAMEVAAHETWHRKLERARCPVCGNTACSIQDPEEGIYGCSYQCKVVTFRGPPVAPRGSA